MCFLQWGTKACLLLLYWRLTQNLKQSMIVKCAAVYVAGTYITMELVSFLVIKICYKPREGQFLFYSFTFLAL